MSDFTVADLEQHIDDLSRSGGTFSHMDPYDSFAVDPPDGVYFRGSEIEVAARGGTYHDGGSIYVILKVDDRLFRKTGHYSSWDSSTWDGPLVEVKEIQKTVDDYVPIEDDSFSW